MELKKFVLIGLLGIGILSACKPSNFEKTECQVETPQKNKIECGYLSVPENRNNKDSPLIKIHVAIIHSENEKPKRDPVVVLHGGPGRYAIDHLDHWINIFSSVLAERDLIVVDQRGTGYSQPLLNCPEAEEGWYQNWTKNLTMKETEQLYIQDLQKCHDRLIEDGVNLAAYTSTSNAADIEDLRQALGYSEWNIFGVSYGTKLALTLMRDHPDGIRSVILDSSYPLQVNLPITYAQNAERSLKLLFEKCKADANCNHAYPDLETVFYNVVDHLNEVPIEARVRRPVTDKIYSMVINGDRLINIVFNTLYITDEIPYLPGLIYTLQERPTGRLGNLTEWIIFSDDSWSEGMHFSVQCSEEVPFGSINSIQEANANVNPDFLAGVDGTFLFEVCNAWSGIEISPTMNNEPVTSDIPTLVLAGEYDPVTPPNWGRLTAETLGNSKFLEFPGFGHGILGFGSDGGACSRAIASVFLDDPDAEIDTSCVDKFEFDIVTK